MAFTILFLLLSGALFYVTLLLREDEEARLRDASLGAWVWLDDTRKRINQKQRVQLNALSKGGHTILSRVFGNSAWGPRALASALVLATASALAELANTGLCQYTAGCRREIAIHSIGILVIFLLGILPAWKQWFAWIASAVIPLVGYWTLYTSQPTATSNSGIVTLLAGFGASAAWVLILIQLFRTTLTWAARQPPILVVLAQIVMVSLAVVPPVTLAFTAPEDSFLHEVGLFVGLSGGLVPVFLWMCLTFILLLLLLQRTLLGVWDRPLYNLHRFDLIFQQRKLLLALATALLGLAIPGAGNALREMIASLPELL